MEADTMHMRDAPVYAFVDIDAMRDGSHTGYVKCIDGDSRSRCDRIVVDNGKPVFELRPVSGVACDQPVFWMPAAMPFTVERRAARCDAVTRIMLPT
jgi:hypothetical protein